jgi:hypothetical protein
VCESPRKTVENSLLNWPKNCINGQKYVIFLNNILFDTFLADFFMDFLNGQKKAKKHN